VPQPGIIVALNPGGISEKNAMVMRQSNDANNKANSLPIKIIEQKFINLIWSGRENSELILNDLQFF